jgi:hypothetical protein
VGQFITREVIDEVVIQLITREVIDDRVIQVDNKGGN